MDFLKKFGFLQKVAATTTCEAPKQKSWDEYHTLGDVWDVCGGVGLIWDGENMFFGYLENMISATIWNMNIHPFNMRNLSLVFLS